jgi:hypothetical protein
VRPRPLFEGSTVNLNLDFDALLGEEAGHTAPPDP